ncbi:MAG: holo-ACP synthase [Oscillospiraceae bacterium]|nr:holo-ACP synthase [Oscillospiraceae bacterium]
MRVGTDIVKIERIEKSLKSPAFLNRVYSEEERALILEKGASSAAANFAAKEAFSKALGSGVRGFSLSEISVLRDEMGKPYFSLSGKAAEKAEGLKFDVSLAHEKEYAIAFVIAWEEK